MEKNRWEKIEEIFEQVIALDSENRRLFIEEKCSTDDELKREIISLIENHESSGDFLDGALFSTGLQIIENESDELLRKKNFAHYKIHKLLGRGGMGTVYLAEDKKLERLVALKILPRRFTDDEEHINLFRQEARAASQFSHPNIAHVYEFGNRRGQFYLSMEYVRGTTLRELINEKKLSLKQSVVIVLQIAKALAVAHRAGITHRDIKPENVIVASDDDTVKVLDFGLAKFEERAKSSDDSILDTSFLETSPGIIAGTTAYMSPEQVRGQNADFRTDIWSLGVTLYELIAGNRPFRGETRSDIHAAILLTEIELPNIAEKYLNLERIVDGRFEAPAVSHDGKQISAVYKKDEEAKYQIAVWNLADKNSMRFMKPLDGNVLPGDIYWKKDGKSLVYILSQKGIGNLWEQPVDEPESKQQLTFFTSSRLFHFAFSNDEKEVICARGLVEGYLVLMSLD